MYSHLDILVDGKSLTLPEDFSLDITEENPLFHDTVAMHSDPVQAPMDGNRHIFSNVDDPQSDLRPISLEHKEALIHAEGFPLRSGVIVIQDEEELVDSFSFNIDQSAQTLEDMLKDLKCQDVPLIDKIPIGEKISRVNIKGKMEIHIRLRAPMTIVSVKKVDLDLTFDPQALGFSYPGVAEPNTEGDTSSVKVKQYPEGIKVNIPKVTESYINVSEPYGSGWKYCNARVCYTHYGLDDSKRVDDVPQEGTVYKNIGTIGETTDDIMKVDERYYSQYENYGPYWVLDANRPQSGICFYVLYFLDCLFAHLGLDFDKSALMEIEDLRRLCFFTTHCKYITEESEEDVHLNTTYAINKWLEDRGCGGQLQIENPEEKELEEYTFVNPETGKRITYTTDDDITPTETLKRANSIKANAYIEQADINAYVSKMYATSENFPDESVTTILESLQSSFGIRFHYDYEHRKVTAYLLRKVFRSQEEPIKLPCRVLSMPKMSEKITGVRVKYSAESDGTEQSRNVRTGKRDYDTDFDYIDYPEARTQVDYGYIEIAKDLRTENTTVYVDKKTANAYRWKISKESTTGNVSEHRLFEVGQFKGIEEGDCSPINEDYIIEMVSDFQPMSFNDVNAYAELNHGSTQSVLAAFVDEDMEHEFVTQKIAHPIYSNEVDLYCFEVLQTAESYDPSNTEDGNSPLQEYDWGLALAIMRGGGADAKIQKFDFNYDGFGNARWKTIAGNYAMASDTMDQFGNEFDYNGENPGDGGGERFSLKIRAYKPFLYYEDADGKMHITKDMSLEGKPVDGVPGQTWMLPTNGDRQVKMRGLADTFLSEYIYFLLNRKKFRIHCLMEVAQLADIPNYWHKRFQIGDKIGYIDKLDYSISAKEGIGEVTIDFFAL